MLWFCLCTMHSILGEPCDFFLQGNFEYVLGLLVPMCCVYCVLCYVYCAVCTVHSILGEPCDFFLQGIFEYVLGLLVPLCSVILHIFMKREMSGILRNEFWDLFLLVLLLAFLFWIFENLDNFYFGFFPTGIASLYSWRTL